jgi:hypothetical protein
MKPETELRSLVSGAESDSGLKISFLRSEENEATGGRNGSEDLALLLEQHFEKEKPRAVLLGAFSAMNLRPFAENFPDIRFYVFDAPPAPPPRSPFIWVRFDAQPVLPKLAEKISAFLENSAGSENRNPSPGISPVFAPALAFLEPLMDEYFNTNAVLSSLNIRRIRIAPEESGEAVRGSAGEALALKPALYIIAAGTHTSMIFDLVRQKGSSGHMVIDDREAMPELAEFPALASLERGYAEAIRIALLSEAGPGDIVTAPMEIR